jgi:peptide/nickel transport system permease protein
MPFRRLPPIALGVLITSHTSVLLAGFFAPYSFEEQNRSLAFVPPTRIHLRDIHGTFHMRPFVYRAVLDAGSFDHYREDRTKAFPIRFFVRGQSYQLLGLIESQYHLFGTDTPAKILLFGADAYGRDEFSRLLYGGRISLFAGLMATAVSLILGIALGGLAGFYGRWIDNSIMRLAEVFLTVPWLYLLLSVRAMLPLHIDPNRVFLILILVLGIVGWARPARLVRGVVLSAKERDYVFAARGFGASDLYLLRKHILPFALTTAATQAALYIPQYILAEVTLSFFGLGVSEPAPSWGNMLAGLQQYFVLQSCWWMFAPAVALFLVFLAYYRIFSWRAPAGRP